MQRVTRAVAYGLHRVRSDGARSALVVAGVAAAGLLLASVLVGSLVAQERALARAVDELPPSARTIRAAWFGVPGEGEAYGALDRRVRAALGGRPTPTVLFRESSVGGRFVAFGAVDGLGSHVRLTSGRLPASCSPVRCEVLQLRGRGAPPHGFVVVGRGVLSSTALFGDAVPADRNELDRARLAPRLQRIIRYHQPAAPPLLLAEGVRSASALPGLANTYRSYGWVSELHGGDVHPWSVGGLVADASRARAELQSASIAFDVVAPAEELTAARDRTMIGARRLLLLGGQGAALLLAFAAFAATRLRRPSEASDRRLTLLGVPLWQRSLVIATQGVVLAVAGVALAWLLAIAGSAAIGEWALGRHALLGTRGVVAAGLLVLAAIAAIVVALVARARTGRFGALDLVAAGLVVAIAAALARGAANTDELLRGGGTGVVLLALPVALVAVVGIAAARLLPVVVRTVERALPEHMLVARLSTLSIARRPGAAAAAVAFLTVSVGLALFAAAYRATLEQGRRDQAAFALGADLVLREDLSRLVPVREVATPARLRALGSDVDAEPVVRTAANVAGFSGVTGVAVLGLEPSLLRSLRGSELEPLDLAAPSTIVGPRVGDRLTLRARSSIPGVRLEAAIRRPDGEFQRVALGPADGTVSAPVPRGATLVGLRILPPPRLQERGADAGRSATGTIELGPLPGAGYADWLGIGGASYRGGRLAVTLTNAVETWFRPRQALDGKALPAIVSPALQALADRSGRLGLQVGGRVIGVRIVEVADRFPSTRGDFAVVDRRALETALNLAEPGTGFPTEVWANANSAGAERAARATLRRAPFDALVLDSRVEREASLRDDPIARGSLAMLAIAAGAAFLLALFAVALTTIADLRDDRDALLDLESQGAPPALLRRLVRTRQIVVGALGLAGGVLAGLLLVAIVVDVVAVSASATPPVPPLTPTFDTSLALLGVLVLALLGWAVVWIATRSAFRESEAGRPAEADT
ncbi:MAG TPA: FtsX-like permease family protein [Gaiellaceae bacterium]|nr:FtsX-like permease family protein [Gaiellaceae bacterium]